MVIDLIGATVGWLVQELGTRASRKGHELVFGTPQERAFREVVVTAVHAAVAETGRHLDPGAQEHLTAVLLGYGVDMPDLYARGGLEMGQVITEWIAALGTAPVGAVGYFDGLRVDQAALAGAINRRVIEGIAAQGRAGGPLTAFAEQLWRDDTTERLKTLDRRTEQLIETYRRATSSLLQSGYGNQSATVVVLAATEELYLAACGALFAHSAYARVRSGAATGWYGTASLNWWVWIACTGPDGVQPLGVAHALHAINPDLVLSLGIATAGSPEATTPAGTLVVARQLYLRQPGGQDYRDVLATPTNTAWLPRLTGVADQIATAFSGVVVGIPDADYPQTVADARTRRVPSLFTPAGSLAALSVALTATSGPTLPVFAIADDGVLAAGQPWHGRPDQAGTVAGLLASFLATLRSEHLPPRRRTPTDTRARDLAPRMYLAGAPDGSDWSEHQQRTDEHFVGHTVGQRYELVRKIGGGALNDVWEAAERAFGDTVGTVAVKLQAPTSRRRRAYFAREAALLAACDSGDVIPYRSAGVEEHGPLRGWGYLVTGLASTSLHTLATAGVPAPEVMRSLTQSIARGLQYLHKQDLVHCDVKPANILYYRDRWVLGDLGLSQRSGTAQPEGTIGYMAPERFDGIVSVKADVYALGVTLHVTMSSVHFREESTLEAPTIEHIWRAIESAPPPPPIDEFSMPSDLRDLLNGMLDTDFRRRLSTGDVIKRAKAIPADHFRYHV